MDFKEALKERILILDGAMGTMIQSKGFFVENNEALNLTDPQLIRGIHEEYIQNGADIITANSFGANSITQQRFGRASEAEAMARAAASIARSAADNAGRKVFVAGSASPTGYSLSIASDASDPGFRKYSFEEMENSYAVQFKALAEGGADLLLLETCFDALNAKAAIHAIYRLGLKLPVLISATVSDRSGRLLTGQTLEAFYHSVKHCRNLAAFGLNCSLGPASMAPLIEEIRSFSPYPTLFYPNAGIPDENGTYSESPESFSEEIGRIAEKGLVSIAGGCCGTTPGHIRALAGKMRGIKAPDVFCTDSLPVASGLESVRLDGRNNFTNIGERANVAGSRKFAGLISAGDYEAAIMLAKEQGSTVIDVNMDDPMLDSSERMRVFLRHVAAEPALASAAVMIDSSRWETIIEGLRNAPGKSIVNSISLRDGEKEFIRKALEISSYGASMVVMAFDEEGQATSYERKIEICRRSYELLKACGIRERDIIFDCNVLTIGTGIPEHADFALDFIKAVRYIKQSIPGVLTSGGISNLSFAFRGNNTVREAMHSVFLYHAIKAGLDMAIVNPQMLKVFDSIEPELRERVEDLILNRRPDATARLAELASEIKAADEKKKNGVPTAVQECSRESSPEDRLCSSLVDGKDSGLEKDLLSLLENGMTPIGIVEGPLMKGMERVGELFKDGRMFLPQVVRSARIMQEAVKILQPYMKDSGDSGRKPRFLIATVQGDVHDIGKNITSIILQCSGFEVTDLGVMVPSAEIVEKAVECRADIIGLSGLITPSLSRMEEVCRLVSEKGLDLPVFIGGAAASALHTAVKLAPCYDNVHYGANASETAVMAKKYISDLEGFKAESHRKREELLRIYEEGKSLRGRKSEGRTMLPSAGEPEFPKGIRLNDIALSSLTSGELREHFDWKLFATVCGTGKDIPEITSSAEDILEEGGISVELCAKVFDAQGGKDSIILDRDGMQTVLPMLKDAETGHGIAEFFSSDKRQTALFAVKVNDSCNASPSEDFVRHAVRVTLAEAGAAYIRSHILKDCPETVKLIAPGIGYPCLPDHSLKRDVLKLLPSELGIQLTKSCSMLPEASVCGLIIVHPKAAYNDIRRITEEAADEYAAMRAFDEEEKKLFLSFLLN